MRRVRAATTRSAPGQAYEAIGDVPWDDLAAGDTVRIHWRDEPYREKFLLRGQGTEDAPIVVCGVAGPDGQLPIIDGENAITRRHGVRHRRRRGPRR